MITVCATKPKLMVAIYKKFLSIRLLKNKVINPLQINNTISTDGNWSLLFNNTANNVGAVDKCNNIIVVIIKFNSN